MKPRHTLEILDNDLNKITEVRALYPLTKSGTVLEYSDELSDYGKCRFRISTKDPLLTRFGDIVNPHQYHIRVRRAGQVVWQGAIIDNVQRTARFIEVVAAQYEYYLGRVLIHRDSSAPSGFDDGTSSWKNYRTFTTGTMAASVTTIINNAISDFGNNHVLGSMTLGTVENPNYPDGFKDQNGNDLTGGWSFSDFISLRFDYHTADYVLRAFGIYTNADYEITKDLAFNFKKFLGTKQTNLTFCHLKLTHPLDERPQMPRPGHFPVRHPALVGFHQPCRPVGARPLSQA